MVLTIKKDGLQKDFETMLGYKNRMTGAPEQKAFIDYIKQRIEEMGYKYYTDPFFFTRWEPTDWHIQVLEGNSKVDIPVSSPFPYSGQTDESGIEEELVYVDKVLDYTKLKGKIAVIRVKNVRAPAIIAMDKRSAWPEEAVLPKMYSGTTATSFVKFFYGYLAKISGAAAAILVWDDIPDDMIQGAYLPFILTYHNIPILWVNQTNGRKLIELAKRHKKANFKLTADIEKNSYTETIYAVKPGTTKANEVVIVNTHTDGPNCVEENGAPAILQLMEELKDKELERTHIFLFATGHFRLPEFMDFLGGGFQASSRWVMMHRHLWNGKHGHLKAVACLTLEHLGCLEWAETSDGGYVKTGELQPELVYTGNKFMDKLYIDEVKENRKNTRSITMKTHIITHFGEGEPFFLMGIPDIALCTAPEYLCARNPSQEIEKFDIDLMVEQTQTFANLIVKLEGVSASTIGRSQRPSFLTPPHSPSVTEDQALHTKLRKMLGI